MTLANQDKIDEFTMVREKWIQATCLVCTDHATGEESMVINWMKRHIDQTRHNVRFI